MDCLQPAVPEQLSLVRREIQISGNAIDVLRLD